MSKLSADVMERALAFALTTHAGQVEKNGHPYVMHPLRLMLSMDTDEERLSALLHDAVEDGDNVSFDDLRGLGMPDTVLDTLRLLTHEGGEPYDDYIARIAKHPMARKVKMADLRDNMDVQRLPAFTDKDAERMRRYVRAYDTLLRLSD